MKRSVLFQDKLPITLTIHVCALGPLCASSQLTEYFKIQTLTFFEILAEMLVFCEDDTSSLFKCNFLKCQPIFNRHLFCINIEQSSFLISVIRCLSNIHYPYQLIILNKIL